MAQQADDERAVEQLLFRYAWMVDKRKWELMDTVFAPGATIDYASTGGPAQLPYRQALEWLDRALAPWPFNLHHITNISIELDGDRGTQRDRPDRRIGPGEADPEHEDQHHHRLGQADVEEPRPQPLARLALEHQAAGRAAGRHPHPVPEEPTVAAHRAAAPGSPTQERRRGHRHHSIMQPALRSGRHGRR